jgi:ankyrin repeat protein
MAASNDEQSYDMEDISHFLESLLKKANASLKKNEPDSFPDFIEAARCYNEAANALIGIPQTHHSCHITVPSFQNTPLTVAEIKSQLENEIRQLGIIILIHGPLSVIQKVHILKFIASAERKLQCSSLTVSWKNLDDLKKTLLAESGAEPTKEQTQALDLLKVMQFNALQEEARRTAAMLLLHTQGDFFQRDGISSDFLAIQAVQPLLQPLFRSSSPHLEKGGNTLFHLIAASATNDYDTVAAIALLMGEPSTSSLTSDIESFVAAILQQENQYGERPLHVALRRGKLKTAQFLIELGADVHAAATHPSPLNFSVAQPSKEHTMRWLNGDKLPGLIASSSNEPSPSSTPELPTVMVLKLIHEIFNDEHRKEAIQLAISMLQHGAILPEILKGSPLFFAQKAVFKQIREERNAFLLKIMRAKFSLERRMDWLLIASDKAPIFHKLVALGSFLDSYLESCMHPEIPILKIFQEWASKHSAYYTALQQMTFGFDFTTANIIEELLSPLTMDCQKKYLRLFKGFSKGASYDRIINTSTRNLIIDILNAVAAVYYQKYQEPFLKEMSQDVSQQTDIIEEIPATSDLAQDQFLEQLLEHFKLEDTDYEIPGHKHVLHAFLLAHIYSRRVSRSAMIELSLDQQSTLADALVMRASITRNPYHIKQAINACMQHAFLKRREKLAKLAHWCRGENEVLSQSVIDMIQKDFKSGTKLSKLHQDLFGYLSNETSRAQADHFGISQKSLQNENSQWDLLARHYSEEELKQISWFEAYEYFYVIKGRYGSSFKATSFQPNNIHPIYGITDLGAFFSLGLPAKRPVTLEHITLENMAQERGGNTLLHLAAMDTCTVCRGAPQYNCNARYFRTPLAREKVEDSLVTAENIILINAMLQHRNQYGEMPLHVALRAEHLDLARCFIESGADIHAPVWEPSPLCASSSKEIPVIRALHWLRARTPEQYQPSALLASTSNEVASIPETPLMIVLSSLEKYSPWFREDLLSLAKELLIYGANYPSTDEGNLYDNARKKVEAYYKDETNTFFKIIEKLKKELESKKESILATTDRKKLIDAKLEALTSLEDTLRNSNMPVLRVLHDWVAQNPGLYATLRESAFFVGSKTKQLMEASLKIAPAYYREKYKDLFNPSQAAISQHQLLPGPTTSLQNGLESDGTTTSPSALGYYHDL